MDVAGDNSPILADDMRRRISTIESKGSVIQVEYLATYPNYGGDLYRLGLTPTKKDPGVINLRGTTVSTY